MISATKFKALCDEFPWLPELLVKRGNTLSLGDCTNIQVKRGDCSILNTIPSYMSFKESGDEWWETISLVIQHDEHVSVICDAVNVIDVLGTNANSPKPETVWNAILRRGLGNYLSYIVQIKGRRYDDQNGPGLAESYEVIIYKPQARMDWVELLALFSPADQNFRMESVLKGIKISNEIRGLG